MLLKCKACGAALEADGVDLGRGIAVCRFCKAVTRLDGPADGVPNGSARVPAERPKAPLPPKFKLDDRFGVLTISWRWFSPAYIFLAFFCVAWDSFLVFWYSMALGTGAPWVFAVFPIVHVAVGAALTYATVGGFVNSTTVRAGEGRLAVRHGPLPWPGNLELDSSEIDQLYCAEKVRDGKNGTSRSYEVYAVTPANEKRKLLEGLPDADQALFVEQGLEEHLGLKDRPVGGELPR